MLSKKRHNGRRRVLRNSLSQVAMERGPRRHEAELQLCVLQRFETKTTNYWKQWCQISVLAASSCLRREKLLSCRGAATSACPSNSNRPGNSAHSYRLETGPSAWAGPDAGSDDAGDEPVGGLPLSTGLMRTNGQSREASARTAVASWQPCPWACHWGAGFKSWQKISARNHAFRPFCPSTRDSRVCRLLDECPTLRVARCCTFAVILLAVFEPLI